MGGLRAHMGAIGCIGLISYSFPCHSAPVITTDTPTLMDCMASPHTLCHAKAWEQVFGTTSHYQELMSC